MQYAQDPELRPATLVRKKEDDPMHALAGAARCKKRMRRRRTLEQPRGRRVVYNIDSEKRC